MPVKNRLDYHTRVSDAHGPATDSRQRGQQAASKNIFLLPCINKIHTLEVQHTTSGYEKVTTILFICLSVYAQAQKQGQARIDSLLPALQKAAQDTNKVKILDDLCSANKTLNTDEGIKYGQQGLALAQKLGWDKGIAQSYKVIGNNYLNRYDYAAADDYYQKALKKFGVVLS